jgi:hypothetical protein
MTQQQGSEVAALVDTINAECVAARRGLCDFAEGSARHAFIRAHEARLHTLHSALTAQIGPDEATRTVYDAYTQP